MDKIITLTRQQRETILQHLTANQVQALSEFTCYAMFIPITILNRLIGSFREW